MKDNYWRRRDGHKKAGRFIRHDDVLIDVVSLSPFSFREICETTYAETDNINRNLIRPALHLQGGLERAIRPHESMEDDLRPDDQRRPVLRPLDFTADWERQRRRATARSEMNLDEDDDFDLEMEIQKRSDGKRRGKRGKREAEDEKGIVASGDAVKTKAPGEDPSKEETSSSVSASPLQQNMEITVEEDNLNQFRKQTQRLDEIGHEINKVSAGEPVQGPPIQFDGSENQDDGDSDLDQDDYSHERSEERKPTEQPPDHFIPTQLDGATDFHEKERVSREQYQSQLDVQRNYEQQLNASMQEAQQQGYQDGFLHGEEKASIQLKQSVESTLGNLKKVVDELSDLRRNILRSTQENFHEIAQAVAETLIKRELSVDPQALSNVIDQAIDQLVHKDNVKIDVHPKTFEILQKVASEETRALLKSNKSIPEGEFRVNSEQAVIDGDIHGIIASLLKQANIALFEEQEGEKAS